MSSLEEILEGLDARSGADPNAEQTWNILVQVLLPLVFVLTFVIITGITAYKSAYEGLKELLDKDNSFAEVQLQEKVVELQYQRLLLALEKVKARRRTELGLDLFPAPDRVGRHDGGINDSRFAALCRDSEAVLDDPGSSAYQNHADGLYRAVLEEAQIADPSAGHVRRSRVEQSAGGEILDWSQSRSASDGIIVPANRRLLHHHVLDFLEGLEAEIVTLQVGVVRLLFEEKLAAGAAEAENEDPAVRAALRRILDPAMSEEEQRAGAEELYRNLVRRWRSRLGEEGYLLLSESWRTLNG
jgi:hypothetical protein